MRDHTVYNLLPLTGLFLNIIIIVDFIKLTFKLNLKIKINLKNTYSSRYKAYTHNRFVT
jgi:hypothetical protein